MRHADLQREATTVVAKAASTLLYDTAVWYLLWVCGCGWCGGMSDAMGSKIRGKTFSTAFFDWILQWKNSVEKSRVETKSTVYETRFGLQSKKAVFD